MTTQSPIEYFFLDFENIGDPEKDPIELAAYIDNMTQKIMNESDCTKGDARNALCLLLGEKPNEEEETTEDMRRFLSNLPFEALMAYTIADYHHKAAIRCHLTNRLEYALEHWTFYKFLLRNFIKDINIQRKGGKAKHKPASQLKEHIESRLPDIKGKRSKRAIALALVPEIKELAPTLGHTFTSELAIEQFTYKHILALLKQG